MRSVQQYTIQVADEVVLLMPEGARLLHLAERIDAPPKELHLWAEVDDSQPLQERTFRIYGTGYPIPGDVPLHHVGTVDIWVGLEGRPVTWHVYELHSPEYFLAVRDAVGEARIGEALPPWRDKPTGGGNGR